jgi:3-oxoacyl-[acyl-carrier protein] reductase
MTDRTTAALVTGASRGIGRAIAKRFADDDRFDTIALLDINDRIGDVADDLVGGVGYTVDVSDHDAVRDAVDDVEEDATIEAAVNNAGLSRYFWIGDLEPDEWDRILDVNLKGQYNVARWVAPRMYRRESGAMVNISSGAGTHGSVSGGVHYSASKGGVLGLTRGLAKQLSPQVRVNCVVPGLIDTSAGRPSDDEEGLWSEEGREKMERLTLAQRVGQPAEVADVVHFLCGEGASYMTGSVVPVDGGAQLSPTQEFLMPESSLKPEPEPESESDPKLEPDPKRSQDAG